MNRSMPIPATGKPALQRPGPTSDLATALRPLRPRQRGSSRFIRPIRPSRPCSPMPKTAYSNPRFRNRAIPGWRAIVSAMARRKQTARRWGRRSSKLWGLGEVCSSVRSSTPSDAGLPPSALTRIPSPRCCSGSCGRDALQTIRSHRCESWRQPNRHPAPAARAAAASAAVGHMRAPITPRRWGSRLSGM